IIPCWLFSKIFLNKVVRNIKSRENFDVILIENYFIYAKKLKKIIKNQPIILHLHNDFINVNVKNIKNKINFLDSIISISNYLKLKVEELNTNISVQTIYNGIDLSKFRKSDSNEIEGIRKKYNIADNETVIVFAGRLIADKGIKELLMAFNSISKKLPITLLIIGNSFFNDNDDDKFIKDLKDISKVKKEKIIFTGYIPYENMRKMYSIADIGCVPSIWEEPFGLTVVEQMAIGLPMIVSNSGAIPEIVSENCAIIIDKNREYILNLKRAILRLYSDINLRQEMGKESRKRAEKFSNINFSKQIYKYIQQQVEANN
ncbi:MAG: glycosyltransferase family 4 protein, partial [Clostridium butyricum]